jgi:ribosome-binding ATPase YchF (GTP1/OBG family)
MTVPDARVDLLSRMYQPLKTTHAQVEYFLPASGVKDGLQGLLNQVRDADALILVVRNFGGYGFDDPTPAEDFTRMDAELLLSDQVQLEGRLERLAAEKKKSKKFDPDEEALVIQCLKVLEEGQPLRKQPELARAHRLRGFGLLSAKPILILFNNADDDDAPPDAGPAAQTEEALVIRAKLEEELGRMTAEEAAEFLKEFQITASALDRVIERTYRLMGLISFFTVGEDEVKAWTIPQGTEALDAAGVIHSDIKKGFIRAEVVAYNDLVAAGTMAEAKKRASVRLEGKTYVVEDGDVAHFRFNV